MLGTDGRLYDSDFDFDGDGKLNAYEYSVMDDVVFGHEDTETSEVDELEDELSLAGLDATELEYMDAEERRETLEDAGLEVKLRESRGNRIKAACGQLVSEYNRQGKKTANRTVNGTENSNGSVRKSSFTGRASSKRHPYKY